MKMNDKMNLAIWIFLSVILSVSSVKIFLIGGAADQNSLELYGKLATLVPGRPPMPKSCDDNWNTTKCPRIAVATSASASTQEGNDAYSNDSTGQSYKTMFNRYGMSPKHITVQLDNYRIHSDPTTSQGKNNIQIISQADVILFNGGDQSRHIRSWMNDNGMPNSLLEVLKKRIINNQVICAGTSAGSMIWADRTYGSASALGLVYFQNSIGLYNKTVSLAGLAGQSTLDTRKGNNSLQYNQNGGKIPAFGLMPFPADTHFSQRGRLGRLIPALIDLGYKFGIGIDENSVLYYDNGLGYAYGQNGVTFVDLSDSKLINRPYFTIQNVYISYLTSGDKYDFNTRKVTSSKQIISSPRYPRQLSSYDIFKRMQIPLLMTHLVDQVPKSNIGKSYRQSGFPVNTPTFVLTFYKNPSSKGYYSRGNYTVENITVDVTYENCTSQFDKNCENYNKLNQCQSCLYEMKIINNRCSCQIGKTFHHQIKRCLNCHIQNCKFCSFQNICKICRPNHQLVNNKCLFKRNQGDSKNKNKKDKFFRKISNFRKILNKLSKLN